MTTTTFGYALPMKPDDLKPGMLVSAELGARRVLGLVFQGERELLIAVIQQQGGDTPVPYVLDIAEVYTTLTQIFGDREFEPAGDAWFQPMANRRSAAEGLILASDGRVGISVRHNDMGRMIHNVVDFETGLNWERAATAAIMPPWKLFIRRPGTETRVHLDVSEASAPTS